METGSVVLEKKISTLSRCIFSISLLSPHGEIKAGSFIWRSLNLLYLRMHCAKFGWNWPTHPWEEDENVKRLQTDRQMDQGKDQGMIIMGLYNLWDFIAVGQYDDEQSYCPITWTYFVQKYLLGLPRKTFISGIWDFEYAHILQNLVGRFFKFQKFEKVPQPPPTPYFQLRWASYQQISKLQYFILVTVL